MSSERTVRRKVSIEKKKNYDELQELFNKLTNICKNITEDEIDAEVETTESDNDETPLPNETLNLICVLKEKTLQKLVTDQFKRHASDEVENEEPVKKKIFDINLAKNNETMIADMLDLNVKNKTDTDKNCCFRLFLQYSIDEASDEDSDDIEEYFPKEDLEYLIATLETNNPKIKFVMEIRELCLKYAHIITHQFVKELILKLRKETGAPFPNTAETFFKTPRTVNTRKMGSGQYCHYGLENALRSFIDEYVHKGIVVDCIKLLVSIDGAPLAVSSEKGLWIISVSEKELKLVEVLAIYHGEDKPSNVNEFLKEFKEEVTLFINNGISHKDKHYSVILDALVCDAPAKSYCLCVKYHSGYYCCTKCTIEGEYDGAVHFPGSISTLRTDEKVKNREYNDPLGDDYQKSGETILKDIPKFGLVTNVVLDYMHLICLGVMLKLIELWIKNILSDADIDKISERLINIKQFVPSDFCRNPRQFRKIRRLWKATELRQFLLYTGPVVLLNILPSQLYDHFLYLHIAVSILVNPILCKNDDYLNYADQLLQNFVSDFEVHYGRKNVTFNVHNLLHIVTDVRHFGALDEFSAFRFENHIRKIKQLVRNGNQPLVQIWKRLAEIRACKVYSDDGMIKFDLSKYRPMQQFHVFKKDLIHIDCRNESNNCILLKNGYHIQCHYLIKDEQNNVKVVGKMLKVVDNLYKNHLEDASDRLHIKIVEESKSTHSTIYSTEVIAAKVCKFPLQTKNYFAVIPLIHTFAQ